MCLAKAYIKKSGAEPILEDIAHMQLHTDRVELETLFGDRKIISGRVTEINFSTSVILLDQTSQSDDA